MQEFLTVVDYTRFDKLTQKVITFTCTLTHTSKYRKTCVSFSDVVYQFHDQNGFTNTRTTEQTDLTTFCIRLQQVDYFDTGKEHFSFSRKFFEFRRSIVDRFSAGFVNRTDTINSFTNNIEQTTFNLITDRHFDRSTCINCIHSTNQTISRVHCDCTYTVFTKMLLNF